MSARLVALAVALALVLPACSLVRDGGDQAEARPLTVVLFDVSRSTQDPASALGTWRRSRRCSRPRSSSTARWSAT